MSSNLRLSQVTAQANPYVYQKITEYSQARPYGFDAEQGLFTREQAMKDFNPGIIPEKEDKNNAAKKVAKTLAVVAAAVLAYAFRGKIKAGANGLLNTLKPYAEKVLEKTPQAVKDVAKKAINAGKKVASTVKPYVDKVLNSNIVQNAKKGLDKVADSINKLFA